MSSHERKKNYDLERIKSIYNKIDSLKKNYPLKSSSEINYNFRKERPSLIKINEIIRNYGKFSKKIINPASSGEESDFEEKKEKIPNLNSVIKKLFDLNTIMIVKDINYFPKEAYPRILILNLENWIEKNHIIYFLDDIPCMKKINVEKYINDIFFFDYLKKKCAWIKFNDFYICKKIINFFYNPIKKLFPSKNSKGEKLDIFLSYNLLEITKSNYYGIVIRNLPQNSTSETLKNFCENYIKENKDSVKYCLKPYLIKDNYCSIVVLKELEYAENLCYRLNNQEVSNKKLKVNLHPKICKIRNNFNSSFFHYMFNNNGYKFPEEIEQSGDCVKFTFPLTSLYEKNNLFDNDNKIEEGEIKEDNKYSFNYNMKNIINENNNNYRNKSVNTFFNSSNNNTLICNNNLGKKIDNNIENINSNNNNFIFQNSNNAFEKLLNGFKKIQEKNFNNNIISNNKEDIKTKENLITPKNNYVKINNNNEDIEMGEIPNEKIKKDSNKKKEKEYSKSDIEYYTYDMKDFHYYKTKHFIGNFESKKKDIDKEFKNNSNKNYKEDLYRKDKYKKEKDEYNKNNNGKDDKYYNQNYKERDYYNYKYKREESNYYSKKNDNRSRSRSNNRSRSRSRRRNDKKSFNNNNNYKNNISHFRDNFNEGKNKFNDGKNYYH